MQIFYRTVLVKTNADAESSPYEISTIFVRFIVSIKEINTYLPTNIAIDFSDVATNFGMPKAAKIQEIIHNVDDAITISVAMDLLDLFDERIKIYNTY